MVSIGNLTASGLWVGSVKADSAFIGNKQVWSGGGASVHYIDYINTNIAEMVTDYTPNSSTWVEGRFRGSAVGNWFVGTTDGKWRFFNSQTTFYVDVNGMSRRIQQSGWDTTKWYDLSAGNCYFTCVPESGTTLSNTGTAVSVTYSKPLSLGSSTYQWQGEYVKFDCAGFKVWEGNTLIKDYRPAKDENGVVCLYEEVSGTYCYPTNSGGVFLGYEPTEAYGGFTMTAREANTTVSMSKVGSAPNISLEYSTDNGENWSTFTVGTTSVTLSRIGDKVSFRAGSQGNTNTSDTYTLNYNKFVVNGAVDLSGNFNSILNRDYDSVTTINSSGTQGGVGGLFWDCPGIVDASRLKMTATTIGNFTYNHMFYGCYTMTKAPEIFATTVGTRYAFGALFMNCSSLTEIKIHYTGNFGGERTSDWVNGVAASGTIYYAGTDTTVGTSAIPSGWTVTPFS